MDIQHNITIPYIKYHFVELIVSNAIILYQSSAVYGRTIFWAPKKDNRFNGTY